MMPEMTLPPPQWVDTGAALEATVGDLSAQRRLAVDTESNSLHAYRERVCLIQFSTPNADYILDPLELNDLTALGSLFADAGIEKIFHAVEYDLICLRRDYGFTFANLFDTMHAARVLGYPAVGLDRLLDEKLGIQVDKRYQKADWAARPLSAEQVHYARLDTHYLFELRDIFEAELRAKSRWELAQEDFRRAAESDPTRARSNGDVREKFRGRRDLTPRALTIAGELAALRESVAERMDRPPFKVMDDETLIAVARAAPGTAEELAATGMSPRQIKLWGESILAAVSAGTQAPLLKRKQVQRMDDATLKRLDKLKEWRKKAAKAMEVESDIVLPKQYLQSLAEQAPRSAADLQAAMSGAAWRFARFGTEILKVLED